MRKKGGRWSVGGREDEKEGKTMVKGKTGREKRKKGKGGEGKGEERGEGKRRGGAIRGEKGRGKRGSNWSKCGPSLSRLPWKPLGSASAEHP